MRANYIFSLSVLLAAGLSAAETEFHVHGKAWMDYGRIVNAEDTLVNALSPDDILNYNGNSLFSPGAQFTVIADLGDNLEAGMGFGNYRASHAIGSGQFSYLAISLYQSYITEARLTWFNGDKEDPSFSITAGAFPYIYNRDVKNLGLYLLRGPVYPGALIGGFQDPTADSARSNIFGLRLHHSAGVFSHDLILTNEREIPPTFDWSLAYLAHLNLGAFQIGAGANFYRLIPYNSKLETPGKDTTVVRGGARRAFIEVDNSNPAAPDTTFFTHQGIKLDLTASLDIKKALGGIDALGDDDLKLYGEAAVIGVQNYGKAYGKIAERIPVMVGFNFPTWRFLDHFSLEVEYYGAKYRNDLALVGNNNVVADWTIQSHPIPSPKPPTNADYGIDTSGYFRKSNGDSIYVRGTAMDKENLTKDDLKWSLFLDKIVAGHIQFAAQIANDHYRPRPVASGLIKSWGGTAEAFASPKDWYYMFRVGYFF